MATERTPCKYATIYDDDGNTRKRDAKYHAAYHGQFDQYVMLNVDGVLSRAVEWSIHWIGMLEK